jgi:hypothetical protein
MLVAMAILLVLVVVMSNALNQAMTGSSSAMQGTVASHEDRMYLLAIFQSMAAQSQEDGSGRYPVPGEMTRRRDPSDNTTAALFSSMVARRLVPPAQLISGSEYNPNVEPDEDYDYAAWNPAADSWWDPKFKADLDSGSNTSFAHVPLHGERLRRAWVFSADSSVALLGNRGPKDGRLGPFTYTIGRSGAWGGHVVFGDGHVEFLETFTPPNVLFDRDGLRLPDNLYAIEDGPAGTDAILAFTKRMTPQGPVLQFD